MTANTYTPRTPANRARYRQCQRCEGSGALPSDPNTDCPSCSGTGLVSRRRSPDGRRERKESK